MKSKWKIRGIETHVFGEDGNLYRLPYTKGKRSFGVRLIKKQYPNRWVINGTTYSERQLKHRIYKDAKPIVLFMNKEDSPF